MSEEHLKNIVVGLGKTGFSCARYLAAQGVPFCVVDTRQMPPCLTQLQQQLPDVPVYLGALDAQLLGRAERLILSPGLSTAQPALQAARTKGARIVSDIDLFCEAVAAPVVAITGSNAKSTVTTLVGEMAEQAGIAVGVGGNLGTPVLDLLTQGEKALYVLELSSFQLEITDNLRAEVATILNISPDHMDRYPSLEAYTQAKARIFNGCRQVVVNRDEAPLSMLPKDRPAWSFGLDAPASQARSFGLLTHQGETWLAQGTEPLMAVREVCLTGRHNVSNALAALALGAAVQLPMAAMLETLRNFAGLAHRCQWVAQKQGVDYINDSKGTNVGATVAALQGLGMADAARIVLIAGGDGKGAEFSELQQPVARYCRHVVLIGKDAPRLQQALAEVLAPEAVSRAETMAAAVRCAAQQAQAGDLVLLSPACASLDMFENFEARGDAFVRAVEAL